MGFAFLQESSNFYKEKPPQKYYMGLEQILTEGSLEEFLDFMLSKLGKGVESRENNKMLEEIGEFIKEYKNKFPIDDFNLCGITDRFLKAVEPDLSKFFSKFSYPSKEALFSLPFYMFGVGEFYEVLKRKFKEIEIGEGSIDLSAFYLSVVPTLYIAKHILKIPIEKIVERDIKAFEKNSLDRSSGAYIMDLYSRMVLKHPKEGCGDGTPMERLQFVVNMITTMVGCFPLLKDKLLERIGRIFMLPIPWLIKKRILGRKIYHLSRINNVLDNLPGEGFSIKELEDFLDEKVTGNPIRVHFISWYGNPMKIPGEKLPEILFEMLFYYPLGKDISKIFADAQYPLNEKSLKEILKKTISFVCERIGIPEERLEDEAIDRLVKRYLKDPPQEFTRIFNRTILRDERVYRKVLKDILNRTARREGLDIRFSEADIPYPPRIPLLLDVYFGKYPLEYLVKKYVMTEMEEDEVKGMLRKIVREFVLRNASLETLLLGLKMEYFSNIEEDVRRKIDGMIRDKKIKKVLNIPDVFSSLYWDVVFKILEDKDLIREKIIREESKINEKVFERLLYKKSLLFDPICKTLGYKLEEILRKILDGVLSGKISKREILMAMYSKNPRREIIKTLMPIMEDDIRNLLRKFNVGEILLDEYTVEPIILELSRGNYFLDLLKLLSLYKRGYWEDPEIRRILEEMKKVGINVEMLRNRIVDVMALDCKDFFPGIKKERLREAIGWILLYTISRKKEEFQEKFMESKKVLEVYLGRVASDIIKEMSNLEGLIRKRAKNYVRKKLGGDFGLLRKILLEGKDYGVIRELLGGIKSFDIFLDRIEGERMFGNAIISYVGKGHWMLYDSKNLKMCSYYPYKLGAVEGAAIYYQLDPRVVEIRMFVEKNVPKNVSWGYIERKKNPGEYCLLCYIALDKNNKKVLVLDEANGILDFVKCFWYVRYLLKKLAREIGADYIVACKIGLNGKRKEVRLKIIGDERIPYTTRTGHYFSLGYGDAVKVPNFAKGIIIDPWSFERSLEKLLGREKELEVWLANKNWEYIRDDILRIEYEGSGKDIRMEEKDIKRYWENKKSLKFLLKKGNEIIGYKILIPPDISREFGVRGYHLLPAAVLGRYQEKEAGEFLIRKSFEYIKNIGIKELYSHIAHPAVEIIYKNLEKEGLIRKMEIVEGYREGNWYGGYAKLVRIIL